MTKSMTGFGSASAKGRDFCLEISLKSLNSRFLDVKYHTPPFYAPLEPELRRLIFQKGRRGCFIVRIDRFPSKPAPGLTLRWDRKQAEKWKSLYQKAARELKAPAAISIDKLMDKEGVMTVTEKPLPLSARERQLVLAAFQKALQGCLRERAREGAALRKDILSQAGALKSLMRQIRALSKKQNKRQSEKQSLRLSRPKRTEALEDSPPLQSRELFDREKYDMNEEIVRVEEHLTRFQKIARGPLPAGKRLEFYAQELARELNTIASKSQMGELTLQAVEGKALVERIKEQAQNIE